MICEVKAFSPKLFSFKPLGLPFASAFSVVEVVEIVVADIVVVVVVVVVETVVEVVVELASVDVVGSIVVTSSGTGSIKKIFDMK